MKAEGDEGLDVGVGRRRPVPGGSPRTGRERPRRDRSARMARNACVLASRIASGS